MVENCLKIKGALPVDEAKDLDDKILIIAALWHDVAYIFYRLDFMMIFLEGRRARRIVKKYFRDLDIGKQDTDLISDMIFYHAGSSFGILNKKRSLYHQVLQDADTMEIFNPERFQKIGEQTKLTAYWFLSVEFSSR